MRLYFTVYGIAHAKGSMRAFVPRGHKYPIVTDSNRSVKSWALLVAERASAAIAELPSAERQVDDGPVRLSVAFYLPRPKKYAKQRAPVAHVVKPDLDKLTRAIFDALTGIAYRDDRHIVEAVLGKFYVDVDGLPRIDVRVEPAGPRPIRVAPAPLPLFTPAGAPAEVIPPHVRTSRAGEVLEEDR